MSCTTFRFNFDLTTLRSGAISVTDRNLNKNIDTRSGWLYNPCLCTLQSIATRAETQTLSNALSKYANAIERRIENEELYGDNGIACAVCGNARLF